MQNADLNRAGGTDLFALGQDRMQWLQARQNVLAGNIANANTPDYTARDVSPFQAALGEFDITPTATHANHIGAPNNGAQEIETESEQSIDGNQVTLDQQLEKVADVNDQQHMAVNIYSKYMNMFQTALGK
ncbi:flagellar basal body protein [Gluconobacter wancherniae]|uniref:flagellar basal body protein n=1 Tax=Gluconobacter wancherniae TaxID=1307955 RepID=UPI001B8C88F0|nr:flagellar basal body protein [Gluconobacter wancherniae]MBS1062430.1 flagellar biosynthesis protein FlgB [Gluconobacter wancherniae]MBS1095514.1 flagellar biosynthesis protein FlgB [Gluconobacter wancherniae]